MMSSGIVVLSGKFFGGALLIVSMRTNFSTVGLRRMADGFPAGMSAIRNRYLNGMFVTNGRRVTEGRTESGSNDGVALPAKREHLLAVIQGKGSAQ
jgi:hypothetical protein